MDAIKVENFDKPSFDGIKYDKTERLNDLNKAFNTGLKPVEGVFGESERIFGEYLSQNIVRNEFGNAVREISDNGKIVKTVENLGNGKTVSLNFDDNGLAYLKETTESLANGVRNKIELSPDVEIVKGNYRAQTDGLGRVIKNAIEDIEIKEGGRENLKSSLYDETYQPGDQRGHLIPDQFGGPSTKDNIVAQSQKVNQSYIKRVENIARDLKEAGHKVDYEVKTNYEGSNSRPSSFEVSIKCDGQDYELPEELRKIYNRQDANAVEKLKINVGEKVGFEHEAGMEAAKIAAGITCAVSTVDNVQACLEGEITAGEAALNIGKDTAAAGAIGYGAGFVTKAVATGMSNSSHALISSVGNSCLPAAAVSFGIASYDSVMDYAQGEIDGQELAYDLGENAAGIAGSIGGAALAGAAVGSVVPVAGTAVGAAAGLVGGMVGYAVASGAYESAIEAAGDALDEHADDIARLEDKAKSIANDSIEKAAEFGDDMAVQVKSAITDFNIANKLPFEIG